MNGAHGRRSQLHGYVTVEGGERRVPLSFVAGFACTDGNSQRAKLRRAARLRSARENVPAPGDGEVNESGIHHGALELCFQQSAGNSTSPEGDILLVLIGDRGLDENVAELEPPAWHEHAGHLG